LITKWLSTSYWQLNLEVFIWSGHPKHPKCGPISGQRQNNPIFLHVLDVFSMPADWIELIPFAWNQDSWDTSLDYPSNIISRTLKFNFLRLTHLGRALKIFVQRKKLFPLFSYKLVTTLDTADIILRAKGGFAHPYIPAFLFFYFIIRVLVYTKKYNLIFFRSSLMCQFQKEYKLRTEQKKKFFFHLAFHLASG
jgi:hypothetical protein